MAEELDTKPVREKEEAPDWQRQLDEVSRDMDQLTLTTESIWKEYSKRNNGA